MANLIFDYDGTLHNTMKIYEPSFRKAYAYLISIGKAEERVIESNEISSWLGYSGEEMWKRFLPELEQEYRENARRIIGKEMAESLDSGEAELFCGAKEVLTKLKEKGHTLLFLSNCCVRYQERHTQKFGIDKLFNVFYPAEKFGFIPKYEIFRQFRDDFEGDFIMIGDRFHDMEVAEKNNIFSIGCAYGYGNADELKNADVIVNDVREIPDAVNRIIASKA